VADFLDWTAAQLRATGSLVAAAQLAARREGRTADKLVDGVLEGAKQLLMLPVSTIIDALPLLARQVGRERGKDIELVVKGAEVEMDKRVLDELKDPLIHLVRNAADHGVEPAADRVRAGKPAAARVTITVGAVDGSKVEIALADDGAGIDPARVRAAAVRRGVVTAEAAAAMDEARSIALIFESDVTTSPIVTEISGRGLGLAIVRERVEKLGGRVLVESTPGCGTVFRLLVPVALAVFRGLVVRANRRALVLPVSAVERVARAPVADVRRVGDRDTVSLQGRTIPVVRLAEALDLPAEETPTPSRYLPLVIVAQRDERVAFAVDEISHDEEVLVKPLAPPLRRVRNVAGATLLASGALVPVLNPGDLLRTARRSRSSPASPVAGEGGARGPLSVLVTDDSVTSRMLIKGILEAAGHRVKTTVDGIEALEALRAGSFDLVVSDVEMPRLNGFDLTARIRADRRLADLPVVLVTALASPRDRERGVEVGASAYIVKSEFDQGNLLEIIRRLAG
jgi:two-component system chemotaxis sensor kinase CheA